MDGMLGVVGICRPDFLLLGVVVVGTINIFWVIAHYAAVRVYFTWMGCWELLLGVVLVGIIDFFFFGQCPLPSHSCVLYMDGMLGVVVGSCCCCWELLLLLLGFFFGSVPTA